MRALLLLLVLAVVIVLLTRLSATWRSRLPSARPHVQDELVKDPVCQTYVVMSRAIRTEEGGVPLFFCSSECAARFRRGERRA
jgi:YHS domain-containing protein